MEFDSKEPSWKEVQEVFIKARTSSAPGLSEVPYRVCKNCPSLLPQAMEDPEGDVEERQGSSPEEVHRRSVDPEGERILINSESSFCSVLHLTDYLLRNAYGALRKYSYPFIFFTFYVAALC